MIGVTLQMSCSEISSCNYTITDMAPNTDYVIYISTRRQGDTMDGPPGPSVYVRTACTGKFFVLMRGSKIPYFIVLSWPDKKNVNLHRISWTIALPRLRRRRRDRRLHNVKDFLRPHMFRNHTMVYILNDDRYRSEVLFNNTPSQAYGLRSRSRTKNFYVRVLP